MAHLDMATEGPCAGHRCDGCVTCRRGRCCRRDNPDYKLPELGEWGGPIFGDLGVLNDDGKRVECHCCGEWMKVLARHIWAQHNLTLDEYRAIFGLAKTTALASTTYRDHQRHVHADRLIQLQEKHGLRFTATTFTSEQLSSWSSHPQRLEHREKLSAVRKGVPRGQGARKGHRRFVGVFPTTKSSTWFAALNNMYLGSFATEEDAARAYDAKAKELYGSRARLNFPEEVV